MLSRRHIRLKVMQSLYAYFSNKEDEVLKAERSMLKHFEEVVELKLVIIGLLVELVKYADNFYKEGKKKYLPTDLDLHPNRRFIDNPVVNQIFSNDKLMNRVNKFSAIWLQNDLDIIRKLFVDLHSSDLYQKYTVSTNESVELDKKFIIDALNDCILKNELVHHVLEERSIYWIDDLPFIATIIFGNIKDDISLDTSEVFKDISDKDFALELFRNIIINNDEYENIIVRFAINWDLDRIAIMDQLLLKMAFSEILSMSELPVKVSMNEYIEIAKYYSTSKSRLFINGLLDNFVKTYSKEGKIRKVGRGLI
ncbi:MAG: hypothetical protein CMD16_04185 [Flavobacteriales bacterium]|nr:hypothetical protein [Flavobacteriales bacterium]|tara:strand:- start:32080 stop:33009 length:930 start_codon:yes stop_codon:yes gene_type:complete